MTDTVMVRFHATLKDKARIDRLIAEGEAVSISDLLRRLLREEYTRCILVPSNSTKDAISQRDGV